MPSHRNRNRGRARLASSRGARPGPPRPAPPRGPRGRPNPRDSHIQRSHGHASWLFPPSVLIMQVSAVWVLRRPPPSNGLRPRPEGALRYPHPFPPVNKKVMWAPGPRGFPGFLGGIRREPVRARGTLEISPQREDAGRKNATGAAPGGAPPCERAGGVTFNRSPPK